MRSFRINQSSVGMKEADKGNSEVRTVGGAHYPLGIYNCNVQPRLLIIARTNELENDITDHFAM